MQNLNPKVIWIFFFQFIIGGVFLLFFLIMFLAPLFATQMADKAVSQYFMIFKISLIFALYLIFCYIWAKLTYRFWLYDITEDAYKIEQGVIWKRYVSRLLGLSELRIQTAGFGGAQGKWGGFSEGRLPGIDKEKAEQLREQLISKVKGKKQGL
jgi:membrane protein YdbS with pleckstrin-like domain